MLPKEQAFCSMASGWRTKALTGLGMQIEEGNRNDRNATNLVESRGHLSLSLSLSLHLNK